MPRAWSAERERQYKHIRSGLMKRGRGEETAEEIAARTVNKERARSGEGLRSHKGPGGRTRDQLYEEAKDLSITGRSRMNKAQLLRAVNRKAGRRGA